MGNADKLTQPLIRHAAPGRAAGLLLAAIFFAATQLQVIVLAFGPRLQQHMTATQGIVLGFPHWRVIQSRVLGPFLIDALRNLLDLSYEQAYLSVVFILLAVFYSILLFLARQLWHSTGAALGVAAAAWVLNAILMRGLWLYVWDFIDLIVFTLFTWAILTSKPMRILGLIVAVEIFNREIVILWCLWLMVDALLRLPPPSAGWKSSFEFRPRQFFTAVMLLAAGSAVIEFLRQALFIKEIGPLLFFDAASCGRFFNFNLSANIRDLWYYLKHPLAMNAVYNVLILGMPFLALRTFLTRDTGMMRASIFYLMLWIATVLFGFFYETRDWLAFVPYLVLVFPLTLGKASILVRSSFTLPSKAAIIL